MYALPGGSLDVHLHEITVRPGQPVELLAGVAAHVEPPLVGAELVRSADLWAGRFAPHALRVVLPQAGQDGRERVRPRRGGRPGRRPLEAVALPVAACEE